MGTALARAKAPVASPAQGAAGRTPPLAVDGRGERKGEPAHPALPLPDEPDEKKERKKAAAFDPLDPSVRASAQLAPPMLAAAPLDAAAPAQEVTTRARVSMEELLPLVVRRIAWGGDKTKAAVHVELGTGAFAGTTVTVHAEGKRVRLELGGAGDLDALRARLESRLRAAGIDVETGG